MADRRLTELLALAQGGDPDVMMQVDSEIALMPETRAERIERMSVLADETADTYVPAPKQVSDKELEELAADAGF